MRSDADEIVGELGLLAMAEGEYGGAGATTHGSSMRLQVASLSRVGGRRAINADACLVCEEAGLFLIADGMGDTPRSRRAATIALEAVRWWFMFLDRQPADEGSGVQREARNLAWGIAGAHNCLCHVSHQREERFGSTIAAAVIRGDLLVVAHVGDSRVHVLRRRERHLVQLTEDHTKKNEAVWRGMPPNEAEALPRAHALTQAVGVRCTKRIRPFLARWEPGDVLMLSTDGLTDVLEAHAIERVLLLVDDVEAAAQRLMERVQERGGADDASVVLVRWLDEERFEIGRGCA